MAGQEIITAFKSKLAEGLDTKSVCNILLKEGFSMEEINEAVDFIEQEKKSKILDEATINAIKDEREQTFIIYYVIAVAIIVIAGAIAMYLLGLI